MPLTIPTSSGSQYEPIPADNHIGICVGVIDLGTHMETFPGALPRSVHKIKIQFELPEVLRDDESTAVIGKTFNLSRHEKSNFRKLVDGWLGAGTVEKQAGAGLQFLLGKVGLVNVQHGTDKDDPERTYAYIESVTKLPKGMKPLAAQREPFFLDLDDLYLPATLSVYDAEKIRASSEYRSNDFRDDAPRPDSSKQAARTPPATRQGQRPAAPVDDEDDVPF